MGYRELSFEKDSVFLVGGGAGFIGSNLCEAILEMGYTVRCLDDLSTGKYENIEPFTKNGDLPLSKGISGSWRPAWKPQREWTTC